MGWVWLTSFRSALDQVRDQADQGFGWVRKDVEEYVRSIQAASDGNHWRDIDAQFPD